LKQIEPKKILQK